MDNPAMKNNPTPEGPFFLTNQPIRKDITEGRRGVRLNLQFTIVNCQHLPLSNLKVHLWHADGLGIYSAYAGYYPLGAPGSKEVVHPHSEPTEDTTFLRGIQITDENGECEFVTIFPGWYGERALHVHFKITETDETKERYVGEIFFPDELTDKIQEAVEPYKSHPGKRARNNEDPLLNEGNELLMTPSGNVLQELSGRQIIVLQ